MGLDRRPAPDDWLRPNDYGNRVPITIDATKIDATLTDFPVLIRITNTSGLGDVFQQVEDDGGRHRIAFTTDDGLTEIRAEVENWDNANDDVTLWVKVPSISSSVDTIIYMYWDRTARDNWTFIHDHDSGGAEEVWDDNYVLVNHLRDKPALEELSERDITVNQWQGIAHDDEFFYCIYSHTGDFYIEPSELVRQNTIEKRRIDDNSVVLTKVDFYPSGKTTSSGEVLDNKLYIGIRDFGTGTQWNKIAVLDTETLEIIREHFLGDNTNPPFFLPLTPDLARVIEGVEFRNGYWWVIFGGSSSQPCVIGQYTTLPPDIVQDAPFGTEFTAYKLFDSPLEANTFGGQDIVWCGNDEVIFQNHDPHSERPWFERWKWTGSGFDHRTHYNELPDEPPGESNLMSQGITLYKGRIWMIGRYDNKIYQVDITGRDNSLSQDATKVRAHGTKTGAGDPTEGSGMTGLFLDFQGTSEIDHGTPAEHRPAGAITVEAVVDIDVFRTLAAGHNTVVEVQGGTSLMVRGDSGNEEKVAVHMTGLASPGNHFSGGTLTVNQIHHICCKWDGSNIKLFIDGAEDTTGDFPIATSGSLTYRNGSGFVTAIGAENDGTPDKFIDGQVSEVRISDVARSDAWIAASADSVLDNLVSFGQIEGLGLQTIEQNASFGPSISVGAGSTIGA